MTVAREVAEYIRTLVMVGGDHDGDRFKVLYWQDRFLRGALRGTRDAALTVGRGNGKSALVAAVASAVVDPYGPLHGNRRQVVVVASSFTQGKTIFDDVIRYVRQRHDIDDRKIWRLQDSAQQSQLEYRKTGSGIRCIGSNPATAHGMRPYLVLADEPAQWAPARSAEMIQVLRTGMGKMPGSRLIALGTRPADSAHWFARMLVSDTAYHQTHAARPGDPPFTLRTIRRANPSHAHLPSLAARIRQEIADAKRDPDALQSFRSDRLNMGTPSTVRSVLIDLDTWQALPPPHTAERSGHILGVDLGENQSMSAAAAYWPTSGRLEVFAILPETPDLRTRGLADGVGTLYQRMHEEGSLMLAGLRTADHGALVGEALQRWGRPTAICCDGYKLAPFRQVLDAHRFPPARLVLRRMGWYDGAADVRAFRRAVLEDRVKPARSLMLTSALTEARVTTDVAGNAKLATGHEGGRRKLGRDDAAAAAVLAIAEGYRTRPQTTTRRRRVLKI